MNKKQLYLVGALLILIIFLIIILVLVLYKEPVTEIYEDTYTKVDEVSLDIDIQFEDFKEYVFSNTDATECTIVSTKEKEDITIISCLFDNNYWCDFIWDVDHGYSLVYNTDNEVALEWYSDNLKVK